MGALATIGSKLTAILGGSVGDTVAKIAGVFKVPPEEVEAHKFELEQIGLQLQAKAMDAATAEVQAAADIIKAEAQSQSWLPRNVRPLLLLLWGLGITFNLVVPVIARFWVPGLEPLPIDPWIYKLTAIGFTGYTGFRTWEKLQDKDN